MHPGSPEGPRWCLHTPEIPPGVGEHTSPPPSSPLFKSYDTLIQSTYLDNGGVRFFNPVHILLTFVVFLHLSYATCQYEIIAIRAPLWPESAVLITDSVHSLHTPRSSLDHT